MQKNTESWKQFQVKKEETNEQKKKKKLNFATKWKKEAKINKQETERGEEEKQQQCIMKKHKQYAKHR